MIAGGKAATRLVVEGVGHSFGSLVALADVRLAVEPGEVHCLLGPSGSGKSTLLRLIAGLEDLQRGRIVIDEAAVADRSINVPPERRAVGFVFQDYALFPHLDVAANVGFGMAQRDPVARGAAVRGLLDRLGMSGFASAMPHTLSGGQQQRVALARALAREPRVMLMDEPFSGLDAHLRDEVRATTLDVLRQEGVATLLVTHSAQEALAIADRLSVLVSGRLLQSGPAAEVYERPKSLELATLFGPINGLVGEVVEGSFVETACGRVSAAGDLVSGARVKVLVRPERLRLTRGPQPSSAKATVKEVIGRGSTVHLRLDLEEGRRLEVCELAPASWREGDLGYVSLRADARFTILEESPACLHALEPPPTDV